MIVWDLLSPDDPRWPAFLETVPHDIYHLPGYVRTQAQQQNATAVALLVRSGASRLLVPLLLRPIEGTAEWDATSPYGYPSPLLSGPPDPDLMPALLRAMRERQLVSVFLRLHPLLPLPPELVWPGTQLRHGPTYYIDSSQERFLEGINRNSRRRLRLLMAAELQISVDDWAQLPTFHAAYLDNMRRVEAQDHYRFSLAELRALCAALPGVLHLLSAVSAEGELVGAVLFSAWGGLMQQMYQGVPDAWAKLNPARLLIVALRDWGAARGQRILHLGGGLGGQDDGIARFKRGMASGEASFSTVQLVPRPELYRQLSAEVNKPASSFFPAYRAPGGSGLLVPQSILRP